jgi:peptidoglycan/xylan/chitin deacetylase (PgdA/CDA1 family)
MSFLFSKLALAKQGLGLASAALADQSFPILIYHRFHEDRASTPGTITVGAFEQQLDWLTANKYRLVELQQVVDAVSGQGPALEAPTVALAVDNGDASVYTHMYPIIRRRQIPVTLFIYPSAISRSSEALSWGQVSEMVLSGLVDVQFHTVSHPDVRLEEARRNAAAEVAPVDFELTYWRAKIEREFGLKAELLAWPYGFHDPELEECARRSGFAGAFATVDKENPERGSGAVPHICILERH